MNQPPPTPRNPQGTTILLLGCLILITSCALILSLRVHVRLGALTEELVKLNARVMGKVDGKAQVPDIAAPPVADKPDVGTKLGVPVAPLVKGQTRSAIPQPGEVIVKPLPPVVLGEKGEVKPIAPEPAAGEVVMWDQAHLHMNRTITVTGKIINTKRLATICFLNFTDEQGGGDKFYLVVMKDQFDDWGGSPEQFFLNKTVVVTGKVEDHKGRPQMKINKKEQVVKVE